MGGKWSEPDGRRPGCGITAVGLAGAWSGLLFSGVYLLAQIARAVL